MPFSPVLRLPGQAGVGGACGRALYALAISHETLLI